MARDNQDIIRRTYATLKSLRNNIPERNLVEDTYVNEFHTVLVRLQDIGINVSEFFIPDFAVKPGIITKHSGGARSYSEERYVDRSFILVKLEAILGYFEIITSEKPKTIGFKKGETK